MFHEKGLGLIQKNLFVFDPEIQIQLGVLFLFFSKYANPTIQAHLHALSWDGHPRHVCR